MRCDRTTLIKVVRSEGFSPQISMRNEVFTTDSEEI